MDIPPDLINLLARSIRDAVWYKKKITRLLTSCGISAAVQAKAAANATGTATIQVIPEVIQELNKMGGSGELPIRKLFTVMCSWKDFTSLELDKREEARLSVSELNTAFKQHQAEVEFVERKVTRGLA